MLKPELTEVLGAERFLKEIEVTANLHHPHILPLFDSGEVRTEHPSSGRVEHSSPSFLFYVMPYVEGESLRARIDREKQLPLELVRQVAGALDYAHRHGVVHRDIKPENILIHDGQALVADFGIALALSQAGGGRITGTGISIATPEYMSPEQATGERDIGARSDVYSLACVLYEMLAGDRGNRSLSEDSVREMHKPRFGGDYGLGFWMVHGSASGDTLIHHGGAIAGQRAFLIGDLDARVGVYFMTNSDYLPDATPPAQSEIVYAALKLLRGESYVPRPQRKGIAVDEKVLNSYVGTYELGQAAIVVSRVGRGLALQQNGQSAIYELLAETPVRFYATNRAGVPWCRGDSLTEKYNDQSQAFRRSRPAGARQLPPVAHSSRDAGRVFEGPNRKPARGRRLRDG